MNGEVMAEGPSGQPSCLACGQDGDQTPLIGLIYRGSSLYICPRHLPLLIHDPARLAGRLPGAEALRPAEHVD